MTQSVMRLMHSTSPEGSNSWRTSSLVIVYVRFSITKRVTPLRVMSCALAKSCASSNVTKRTALECIVVTAPSLAIQRVPGSALGRRPARISWEGGCLCLGMGCPHDQVAGERLPLWQARVLAFLTYACTPRRQGRTDKAQPPTAMATTGTRHRVRSLERDYVRSGEL